MSDKPANDRTPVPSALPAALVGCGLVNAGLTAQIGMLLDLQVPATDIMNLLCEHVGKLLALVEPEQLRNTILAEIRKNLPGVVNRHYEARIRTPGGVIVPPPGTRVQ